MSTGGGGGGYQASQEERALSAEQTLLLRQQRTLLDRQLREQDLLQPLILKQLGLVPQYADTANPQIASIQQQVAALNSQIAGISPTISGPQARSLDPRQPASTGGSTVANPQYVQLVQQRDSLQAQLSGLPQTNRELTGYEDIDTPEELTQKKLSELALAEAEASSASLPQRTEIENLTRARTLAALKGELPLDPTLMRELETQEQNLRTGLTKQLGTGYETSSPGIEALADFNRRKAEIIAGAQRAEITLGEQLSGAREAGGRESMFTSAQLGDSLRGTQLSQIFGYGVPGRGIDYGNLASGYNGPLSMLGNERMARMSAASNAAAGKNALFGSIIGAGAGLGAAAIFAASDRRLKKNIHKVGRTEGGIPIFTFKYKTDPEEKTFMGVMAQDVEKKQPEIVKNIFSDYKGVDYSKVK